MAEKLVRRHETGNGWAVFALAIKSDDQIDCLIVASHYRMAGCRLLGPRSGRDGHRQHHVLLASRRSA
jgi:hypothetical protein